MPLPRPRCRTWTAVGLSLALAGLALAPLQASGTPADPASGSAPRSAAAAAQGRLHLQRDQDSGRIEFVRVSGSRADLAPGTTGVTRARARTKATAWLTEHSGLFDVAPDELVSAGDTADAHGRTLTFTQEYQGVPVWGAAIKANLDATGSLLSVNGHLVPDLSLSTIASSEPQAVRAAALARVRAEPPTDAEGQPSDLTGLRADEPRLVIYETGTALGGTGGIAYLAWQVRVSTASEAVSEQLILSDVGTKPLNRWSQEQTALDRRLDTYTGTGSNSSIDDDTFTATWAEGTGTAGLTGAQQRLLRSTAETYWFFRNAFGLDSYDDAGATMRVRDNRLTGCPNASWNGAFVSVCPGLEDDDVIAHEWGHAYTEHTSGLIYQWQSGALNESYSDVWGETVDLINGREDETEDPGPRTTACPTATGALSAYAGVLHIDSPATIAGPCAQALVASGAHGLSRVPQQVPLVVGLDAADGAGPSITDGCSQLTNPVALAGSWVYLDRGTCTYAQKVANALAAGAEGVVFGNNGPSALASFTTGGTFPAIMISQNDGTRIKSVAPAATLITLSRAEVGSSRWLIGEQMTGMDSALRDMWKPECAGNAAKVSDGAYVCDDPDDNGGVHSNSGVPNRAYSLFVDGGEFNDVSVQGVGLDKAAAVWWRANQSYLTPVSDFADFAEALTESCRTLVGHPITALSVTPNQTASTTPVSTGDCAELAQVIEAVELRTDPVVRCGASVMFPDSEPAFGCGAGTVTSTLLKQDFEQGLGGWTAARAPAVGATPGPSGWTTVADPPHSSSRAAFIANTDSCDLAFSNAGVASLTSPSVTMPKAVSLRLSFRHALALEQDYDGASLKLSVNGGPFAPPALNAFRANAPPAAVQDWPGGGSDNPLLGQPAWTGSGDQLSGMDWGTTVLDLAAAGVRAGDRVRIRFELGTDVCSGAVGWYLDDVTVRACAVPADTVAPTGTRKAAKVRLRLSGSHRQGRPFKIRVRVPGGTGKVRFTLDGRRLGVRSLTGGKAVLKVGKRKSRGLRPGRHLLKVRYAGDKLLLPRSVKKKFRTHR